MGAILELSPAAGPFTAEVRRESFYLGTDPDPDVPARMLGTVEDPGAYPRGTVSLPLDDGWALLSALAEVATAPGVPERTWGRPEDRWTVHVTDDRLVITGPLWVYGARDRPAPAPVRTVEIEYADLELLRSAVSAAVGPGRE